MNRPMLFGKYCLLERISIGGMAEVFRAKPFHAANVERYLALKRILPHLAEDDEFIRMFVDEAKLCVQLRHPNIVHIYELGQFQSSYYILMEYISGQDLLGLQKRLRQRRLVMSVAQACYIIMELCKGLAHAHQARDQYGTPLNIIHRDISPQNVLVTYKGQVKLIDFGVAKAASQSTKTQVGVLKGKFGYMSPEQITGGTIDLRSDIFAVGTVFWEMLTNRRLFKGESEFDVFQKVRDADVSLPSTMNPQIPEEVDRIVMKALSKDLDKRYQSCDEMAQDLGAFLRGMTPVYSSSHLGSWMQSFFDEEWSKEHSKHESFKDIRTPEDVRMLMYGTPDGSELNPEKAEGATELWDVEIAPKEDEDLDAFLEQHTVVAAGGFDLNEFVHLDDDDLIEINDDGSEHPQHNTFNREQLNETSSDSIQQATDASFRSHITQRHNAVGQPVVMTPTKILAYAKARRNKRAALAAALVVCALSLVGLIVYMATRSPKGVPVTTPQLAQGTAQGRVVLTVSPVGPVRVVFDGVSQPSNMPLSMDGVAAGTHTLSIKRDGYVSYDASIELTAGEFKPVHVELVKAKN